MKIITKLNLLFALMLALSVGSVISSLWSARQASFHMERLNYARDAYEAHLSLSSNTYQLFKLYGDALLMGDQGFVSKEAALIKEIRTDIENIRLAIATEIDLVGEEEVEELAALAEIEMTINRLVLALRRVSTEATGNTFVTDWTELSRILDSNEERNFELMIQTALAEERGEVVETRDTSRQQLHLYQALVGAFVVVALAMACMSILVIRRRFSVPVRRVIDGVRRFSDGDLDHRIGLQGQDELAEISATFDMMAERVASDTQSLTVHTSELENAVTERTRQLERLLQEAKRSDVNRRRMLTDVSHELRTPLTIIRGEADIALRGDEKSIDVYKEALTRTRDAASHTGRLVDDLLFVARAEGGETRITNEHIDLRKLIDDVLNLFGQAVDLHTDVTQANMTGDTGRLRQAVLVLLENARQYGGTEIALHFHRTPGGYRIAVEDNGPGLNDEDKEKAFQLFYRGSNAAEFYGEGVGLGLPVAKAIVEAHAGTITLEDRPGGGLIASIMFPVAPKLKAVS